MYNIDLSKVSDSKIRKDCEKLIESIDKSYKSNENNSTLVKKSEINQISSIILSNLFRTESENSLLIEISLGDLPLESFKYLLLIGYRTYLNNSVRFSIDKLHRLQRIIDGSAGNLLKRRNSTEPWKVIAKKWIIAQIELENLTETLRLGSTSQEISIVKNGKVVLTKAFNKILDQNLSLYEDEAKKELLRRSESTIKMLIRRDSTSNKEASVE